MKINHALCLATAGVSLAAAFVCEGSTTVTFTTEMEVEIDGEVQRFAPNETFSATNVPCLYKMRPVLAEGERSFGVGGSESGGAAVRVPLYGEGNWSRVALADDGGTVSLKGYKASHVYYLDAVHGNDDWDGTADYEHRDESIKKGPKQSLQAAHDGAAAGNESAGYPVVLVAPGVYSNGVTTTYGSGTASPCKRRLNITKVIGFIATGGADATFIVGAPDPNSSIGGCGENAVAGVYTTATAYLQGFTITGCYGPLESVTSNQRGAAFSASGFDGYAFDCIISNNFAVQYSATCNGVIQRSWIMENESTQYVARSGYYISCVVAGNRITYGNADNNNCAIFSGGSHFFITIDLRNSREPSGRNRLDATTCDLYCCFAYGLTSSSRIAASNWHDSKASDHPVFADSDRRDYRLGMLSPALEAAAYGDLTDLSHRFLVADIEGRMPVVNNGRMRLGAVWNEPPLPCLVILGNGSETVAGGYSLGTNIVTGAGGEVTLTASASRPFIGFEVNGEMLPYAGMSYTFTPSAVDGSATTVRAVYDTNWYVDCVNGNDENPGTASHPKQTIRAATTNAVAGDVIHVAPGTYGALEGSQKSTSSAMIGTRVLIPEGVTVESTDGAKETFIVGAAATGDQVDNATYGTGTNAVRCVYAENGATLRGFTLTGGRGIGVADASGDGMGSAFYSDTTCAATIEDCIVSNNVAYRATIYQAIVRRCRVLGNIGVSDNKSGAAGSACAWHGSIIDDNKGNGTIVEANGIESCTIGTNLTLSGSSSQVLYDNSGHHHLINSLFLYGSDRFQGNVYATNCVFRRAVNTSTLLAANCGNCLFNQSADAINIDSDYRLKPGSVAIDSGDASYSSEALGDRDAYGTPRILNGVIDVGAVEYDWRPNFAEELGKRFTMTYASPTVTTNATGGLVLDGRQGLPALPCLAGLVNEAGPYAFTFELTGGSAQVYVGGVLAGEASGSGEQSIRFNVSDTTSEIRFTFTPDEQNPGAVLLRKFSAARGFAISFR